MGTRGRECTERVRNRRTGCADRPSRRGAESSGGISSIEAEDLGSWSVSRSGSRRLPSTKTCAKGRHRQLFGAFLDSIMDSGCRGGGRMQTTHWSIWERIRRVRAREERRKQRRVCRKVGSALQGRGCVCALTTMPSALRRRHYGDGDRRARRQGCGESTTTARRASIDALLLGRRNHRGCPLRGSRGG